MDEKKKKDNRYRMVIFSDSTFEEIRSLPFRPWYLWALLGSVALLVIILMILLLIFTPLGGILSSGQYTEPEEVLALRQRVLDLESSSKSQELYINNLRQILSGGIIEDTDTAVILTAEDSIQNVERIAEDEQLRQNYDMDRRAAISNDDRQSTIRPIDQLYFVPPVTGSISLDFDHSKDHVGVDVNAPPNTPVKAILSGHVIFSEWTVETGNTIGILHDQGILSFYKHNSSLLKKRGTFVQAGEAVAIIGNTGTLSSGPHLHFELWLQGKPVDPTRYINFN